MTSLLLSQQGAFVTPGASAQICSWISLENLFVRKACLPLFSEHYT